MLKIKDNIDLKTLSDSFEIEITDDQYNSNFNVHEETRTLSIGCEDVYYLDEQNERALLLFDLITLGLVEKVEEDVL